MCIDEKSILHCYLFTYNLQSCKIGPVASESDNLEEYPLDHGLVLNEPQTRKSDFRHTVLTEYVIF